MIFGFNILDNLARVGEQSFAANLSSAGDLFVPWRYRNGTGVHISGSVVQFNDGTSVQHLFALFDDDELEQRCCS